MTTSINLRRKVEVDHIPGTDFTIYLTDEPDLENPPPSSAPPVEQIKKSDFSYDGSVAIQSTDENGQAIIETGRGLACRAYAGNYWSVTLRCDAENKRAQRSDYVETLQKELGNYATTINELLENAGPANALTLKARDFLGYCPKGYDQYAAVLARPSRQDGAKTTRREGEIYLNEIYPLCKQLYDGLSLDPAGSPFGLIAITGATNSSKSLIARGLIFLFLEAAAKQALEKGNRRPHLVTFEDPIEEYFIKDPATDLAPGNLEELNRLLGALNLDYTPRQKDIDTDSLTSVIKDAKRQTPAVLFVGETRDPQDWKELLDFGSSGHLVVTTAHSGSVVEAMTQILRNTDAQTPSQRSEVARRIRGIANIRGFTQVVKDQDSSLRTLLPALWKSTSQSVNNLVADGLSSILPALGQESELGYYGRTYFAKALIQKTTTRFSQIANYQEIEHGIVRKAMEWDIRGI